MIQWSTPWISQRLRRLATEIRHPPRFGAEKKEEMTLTTWMSQEPLDAKTHEEMKVLGPQNFGL